MFQSVSVASRHKSPADVLILGQFKGAGLDKASAALAPDPAVAAALKRPEATGERGATVEAFPSGRGAEGRILIVGLGDKAELTPLAFRDIAAGIGKRLAAMSASTVHVHLEPALATLPETSRRNLGGFGQAFGEALGLLSWSRDHFKGSATDLKKRQSLTLCCLDGGFARGVEVGLALAESTNYTRTLSEAPPNIATPDFIAAEAQKLAKRHGLSCRVLKGKDLDTHELVGIRTVGQASENKPCFIRLEYKPAKAARGGRSRKPVVLIGKNMTYDTGGLSIKGTENMLGMKRDMDGGAAVLGAMHAIATVIQPNRPVVALLSVAENSISDNAYRPDDVMRYRNGVTVEVTNTDAEGRLVLADALIWACEKEDPACIIDLATLTGGVVIALGRTYAGYFCEDESLRARLEAASERTGERIWRLPMHEEYREMMRSDIADILNSAPVREAHPIQGAAFLSYFVKPGIPWAHIDIAGVHAVKADKGPFVKSSATGWGVRLLAAFLDAE